MDVIHLIFTCCGVEVMGDWTEMLNDYYDYIKVADKASLIIYAEYLRSSLLEQIHATTNLRNQQHMI